jgi:drug/metabolite transporter (DMT)-like permease
MLEAVSTPHNRTIFLVLLAICVLLGACAALVGIDDNPPGIFLAFGAAAALVLALVHPWRSVKRYALLLLTSLLGIVLCGVLHNVFEAMAGEAAEAPIVQIVLQSLAVSTFLVAVLIGPPAVLVGVLGVFVMYIRGRRGRTKMAEGPRLR